ncbi:MAG: hypothetical protein JSU07_14155 [Bacteroidetes bacterium]|nr:hypothetical protein [Bacteroidota bacterium]
MQLKEANEKFEEWVLFLANNYSDDRLSRRIDILRKQQVIAEKRKDATAFELVMLLDEITVAARYHKLENNIPDPPKTEDDEEIEYVVIKKERIPKKEKPAKIIKPKIEEDFSSQMNLFDES